MCIGQSHGYTMSLSRIFHLYVVLSLISGADFEKTIDLTQVIEKTMLTNFRLQVIDKTLSTLF